MADFDRIETGAVSNTKVNEQFTTSIRASVDLAESATMYIHLLQREEAATAVEQFVRLANLALNGMAQCREILERPVEDETGPESWCTLREAADFLNVSTDEILVLYQLERITGEERSTGVYLTAASLAAYRHGARRSRERTVTPVPEAQEIKGMLRDTKAPQEDFDDLLQRLFESPSFRKDPFEEPPTRQTLGLKSPPPLPESEAEED